MVDLLHERDSLIAEPPPPLPRDAGARPSLTAAVADSRTTVVKQGVFASRPFIVRNPTTDDLDFVSLALFSPSPPAGELT